MTAGTFLFRRETPRGRAKETLKSIIRAVVPVYKFLSIGYLYYVYDVFKRKPTTSTSVHNISIRVLILCTQIILRSQQARARGRQRKQPHHLRIFPTKYFTKIYTRIFIEN